MSRSLCRTVTWAVFAAAVLAAPLARAQDGGLDAGLDGAAPAPGTVVAVYCSDPDLECTIAPLEYDKTIQLPIAFDWDTGWIPNGSDLQVRFYVKVPAETTVKLNGFFETDWPDAMTLSAPPGRSAYLGFDYGLEVGAQARIDTSILGIPIKWTGDIPYVPKVDFHMKGATLFDPWAFAPNSASASAFTPKVKLFDVNLIGLSGIPSQLSSGGVSLNVEGELKATYTTDRIMIDPAGANETPITSEGGSALRAFAGGAYVEYDVWPEGTVHYDGALHLIPSFYIEALGQRLEIPITDFPITIPIGDQAFVFDPVRVHVPLPDIPPLADDILDFGAVVVGDGKKRTLSLDDIGEATARATGFVDSQLASTFKLLSPTVQIDPGGTENLRRPLHAAEDRTVHDQAHARHQRPGQPLHQRHAARHRRRSSAARLPGGRRRRADHRGGRRRRRRARRDVDRSVGLRLPHAGARVCATRGVGSRICRRRAARGAPAPRRQTPHGLTRPGGVLEYDP